MTKYLNENQLSDKYPMESIILEEVHSDENVKSITAHFQIASK